MNRAIQISERAYDELAQAKEEAIKLAEKENKELAEALAAMGIGAFAGWLILRGINQIAREQKL